MSELVIRPGTKADVPAVMTLLDRATAWLVARGRADQWGTGPQSTDPRRVAMVTSFAASGGLWLATSPDGTVRGTLSVGDRLPYIPEADEPELYVRLLVTDRAHAGRGIGARLLDHARHLAREAGVTLLRVDCFAGGEGALIRYYEKQGFTRTDTFTVPTATGPWPGQILAERLV